MCKKIVLDNGIERGQPLCFAHRAKQSGGWPLSQPPPCYPCSALLEEPNLCRGQGLGAVIDQTNPNLSLDGRVV